MSDVTLIGAIVERLTSMRGELRDEAAELAIIAVAMESEQRSGKSFDRLAVTAVARHMEREAIVDQLLKFIESWGRDTKQEVPVVSDASPREILIRMLGMPKGAQWADVLNRAQQRLLVNEEASFAKHPERSVVRDY